MVLITACQFADAPASSPLGMPARTPSSVCIASTGDLFIVPNTERADDKQRAKSAGASRISGAWQRTAVVAVLEHELSELIDAADVVAVELVHSGDIHVVRHVDSAGRRSQGDDGVRIVDGAIGLERHRL